MPTPTYSSAMLHPGCSTHRRDGVEAWVCLCLRNEGDGVNCVTPRGPGCPRGVGSASKSVLKGLLKGQSGETWGRDPCVIRDNGSSQERRRETKKRVMEGKRGKSHIQEPNFSQVLWLLFSFVCRGGKIQGGGESGRGREERKGT